MADDDVVHAAGCVVWRLQGGQLEVALVHRDRYDDWSHPKGKRASGEHDLGCAVREVLEETGIRGTIHTELPTVRYADNKGRPKVVRYWSMERTGGRFTPNDEVDQLIWVPLDQAKDMLSYSHDRVLLDSLG